MRQIFIIIFFTSIVINLKSQSIIADSLHCVFYNGTSQEVCTNNDTIMIDLNQDGNIDIKLWRYNWIETCTWIYTETHLSKSFYIQPNSNFNILSYIVGNIFTIASKVQIGNIINTNDYNRHITVQAYHESMLGYHCQVVHIGWDSNSEGYFSVRETNNLDTTYYLIKLRISNNAECFQVINDEVSISKISNDNTCMIFVNNVLNVKVNRLEKESFILLYNSQGILISKEKILSNESSFNFENLSSGIYIINLINGKKITPFKFVKLNG